LKTLTTRPTSPSIGINNYSLKITADTAMTKNHFTPRLLTSVHNPIKSLSIISTNYFKVGNHLHALSKTGQNDLPPHYFTFPAIIMYVSAFEAFIQEQLAFALENAQCTQSKSFCTKLKNQEKPYKDFKCWIKEIYKAFDKSNKGIDINSALYHDLIALRELRNVLVHYNPQFIEHSKWPYRIQEALNRANISIVNSNWPVTLSQPKVADWAHQTIKEAILLLVEQSGLLNPFKLEFLSWN
jgi:hypothetical protein